MQRERCCRRGNPRQPILRQFGGASLQHGRRRGWGELLQQLFSVNSAEPHCSASCWHSPSSRITYSPSIRRSLIAAQPVPNVYARVIQLFSVNSAEPHCSTESTAKRGAGCRLFSVNSAEPHCSVIVLLAPEIVLPLFSVNSAEPHCSKGGGKVQLGNISYSPSIRRSLIAAHTGQHIHCLSHAYSPSIRRSLIAATVTSRMVTPSGAILRQFGGASLQPVTNTPIPGDPLYFYSGSSHLIGVWRCPTSGRVGD